MVSVIEKILLFKVLNPDKPVEFTTQDFLFCFVACNTIDFFEDFSYWVAFWIQIDLRLVLLSFRALLLLNFTYSMNKQLKYLIYLL